MLALSFLVLIGTNLVAEGLGQHIPKGYTYFAMVFSVAVEMLNLKLRKRRDADGEAARGRDDGAGHRGGGLMRGRDSRSAAGCGLRGYDLCA